MRKKLVLMSIVITCFTQIIIGQPWQNTLNIIPNVGPLTLNTSAANVGIGYPITTILPYKFQVQGNSYFGGRVGIGVNPNTATRELENAGYSRLYKPVGIGMDPSNPEFLQVTGGVRFVNLPTALDPLILCTDATGVVKLRNASTLTGAGDNLGNHQATQNLGMNCFGIDRAKYLTLCNGAYIKYGPTATGTGLELGPTVRVTNIPPNSCVGTDAAGNLVASTTCGNDNLGNHTATQDLNMSCKWIKNVQGINFCNSTTLYEEPLNAMPNLLKARPNFSVGTSNSISGPVRYNELVGANNIVNASPTSTSNGNSLNGDGNNVLDGNSNLLSGNSNSTDKASLNLLSGTQNTVNTNSNTNLLTGTSNLATDASFSNLLSGNSNGVDNSFQNLVSGEGNSVLLNSANNLITGTFNSTTNSTNSLANGSSNDIHDSGNNLTSGESNTINGNSNHNLSSGFGNIISETSNFNLVGGQNNSVNTNSNAVGVIGTGNTVTNSTSVGTIGGGNQILNTVESNVFGEDNYLENGHGSSILGGHNTILPGGKYNQIMGDNNMIQNASSSIAIGSRNQVLLGQNRIAVGNGVINTCDNSLFVGFNSDLPTLSVTTASGLGTFGEVHIAYPNPSCNPTGYQLFINGIGASPSGIFTTSDERYKRDIKSINNPIEIINQLNGKTYNFRNEEFKSINFPKGRNYGFIAQEIQKVLPEVVNEGKDGYLAVNYQAIIPVLTEAIKAQQVQIDELKASLKNGNSNGSSIRIGDNLNNTDKAELFQNAPNPFNDLTVIKYMIPASVQNAAMYIYDMNGRQIKMIKIETKGAGSVTIEGGDLSEGMYLYSLITDGKEVSTKRMILTKN
jgi:trimeric autotransporter adhesin